jgi:hypothetical protein
MTTTRLRRRTSSVYSQPHSSDLSDTTSTTASVKNSSSCCSHRASDSASTALDTPNNTPNPLTPGTTLTQSVQPHHSAASRSRRSTRFSTDKASRTMDQSLTSRAPSARARDEHSLPQARLPYSPSTPFLSQQHPPRTTASPSTPNCAPSSSVRRALSTKSRAALSLSST